MRIVGYIENPEYKISILHMNLRYAIKFENEGLEQTFKIRESEVIRNAEDVKSLVDENILASVKNIFSQMEDTRLKLLTRSISDLDEFEEVI